MMTLWQDLRYALHSFRTGRSGMVLSAIVLALAIGAATTTYSVVSAVVLRSLPYEDPDALVGLRLGLVGPDGRATGGGTLSRQSVELVLSATRVFESAAYFYGSGEPVLTGMGEPERVHGWAVAPNFFRVLGASPLLGRAPVGADDTDQQGNAVVLSHRFWVSRLGGDPAVLERTLTLDGRIHEVAGVMPPGFDYPVGAQLWQIAPPLDPAPGASSRTHGRYWIVGRLAADVSLEQAHARLAVPFAAYAQEQPGFASWAPALTTLPDELIGPVRKPLLLLLAAVVLVLLIACANVASVLLARGSTRRREIAIRLSLGASRWRVARQLLTESVLLAVASGVGGVAIALWAVPSVVALAGDQLPRASEIGIDWGILAAALIASSSIGILSGILPALFAADQDAAEALKDGGDASVMRSWRIRFGEALVVLQIGLGTLLLTGAGLLGMTFVNLMRVDFGFEPSRAIVAQILLPEPRYASVEHRQAFAAQVLEGAAALPGVEAAAASNGIPLRGGNSGTIQIPGADSRAEPLESKWTWFTHATPEFFRVMGIRLLRGRALVAEDRVGDAVVVNQEFARTFFPGQDPIGRTFTYYGGSTTGRVVGVVNDTRQQSIGEPAPPQIYAPFDAEPYMRISIRSSQGTGQAIAALKNVIRDVDPMLPIDQIGPLSDLVSEYVARERFYAVVIMGSALIALLITSLGVFGLTSYSVSRRMHEMGVRIALGATAGHVHAIMVGRTTLLAGSGIVLGLFGAWATAHLLESLLYGLSAADPRVLGAVALVLSGVAVLAAYPPSKRAARVDPMVVLRAV